MAIRTVGPHSVFPTIAAAMNVAGPGDEIRLEAGYSNETATITHSGMTVFGGTSSHGIVLNLGMGIATVTLTGTAPITLHDASDGNGIVGNAGNNRITVSGGVDAVDGGLGVDRLVVDYRLATGAVTGDSTSNFTEAGGGGRTVTLTAGTIEHFTVLTGAGADTITTGAGNDVIRTASGASTVSAGQGYNIIVGGGNADTITALDGGNFVNAGNGTNTITTGGGTDVIRTGTGADTIVAGGGADRITLHGGADTVDAGAGNDRLIIDYSALLTSVIGGVTGGNLGTGYVGHITDQSVSVLDFQRSENFTIISGSGDDRLTTGGGIDVLRGNLGNDRLNAGAGNDFLFGGTGNDFLSGGTGNDLLVDSTGNDLMSGGSGNDRLFAGTGVDNVYGGIGADLLHGGAGNDRLFAGTGVDTIYGGIGADLLHGGADNDRLFGGTGRDLLTGGWGADSFMFRTAAEAGIGAARDVITDFSHGIDTIDLGGIDADSILVGNQAFGFIGAAAFSHVAGQLRYAGGNIQGDMDGDGLADFAIQITNLAMLTQSDFVL